MNDSESISWSIEKENELRSNEQAYLSILQLHGALHVKSMKQLLLAMKFLKNLKRKILHISKLTGRIETQKLQVR